MKNPKLHTVNKWNIPAFMPKGNLFVGTIPGQSSQMVRVNLTPMTPTTPNNMTSQNQYADYLAAINKPAQLTDTALQTADLQAKNAAMAQYMAGNRVENPFNFKETFSADSLKSAAGAAMTGVSGAVGETLNNVISGGYSSGAGSTIGSVGRAVGTAVSAANPVLGSIINIASDVVGGAANALLGEKVDTARLGLAKKSISKMKTLNTDVNTLDDISDLEATGSIAGIYKGGPLNKSAKRKQGQLEKEFKDAKDYAFAGMENSADNIMQDQINKAEATSFAFGGPFDMMTNDNMGAIGYGFMSDYLNSKRKQAEQKNNMGNMFAGMPSSMFAFGGEEDNAARRLAKGWYDGTIGGFVNMGKALYNEAKKALSSERSDTESFTGAGATNRWKPAYRPKNTKSFNEAFDEARSAGAETFMFGDKEYSTVKEANPIREFNNRFVGAGRTEQMIRDRGVYGKDYGPILGPLTVPSMVYAFGGDMQTNSADFPTGLTHIKAGGQHEENPNDGVQMGVDSEGVPNLVEEGETVYDDYVYSNRIYADGGTLQKFHLSKKSKLTFADISKRLENEIKERVNDPISKAGFEKQMAELAEQQERQKQEMDAERAKEAFEALSPEEQTAIMQQVSQQAAQEQAVAEQQAMQQPSPEEVAMVQQAQQQADGTEAMVGQEAPMMAKGGHLYAEGSKIRRGVYKALGFHTDKEFLDWARKHKLRGDDKWKMDEDALKNLAEDDEAWKVLISDPTFAEAVKDNPALVHALANNYDFGAFTPDNTGNVTFRDISRGNWTAQDYEGWKGSQDPAWLEAVEKGLVKEGMKQEDIAKALRQTDAYKRGSKWLQDSEDNRLRYLRTILEDENSPEVAKNYARKFIDANGWKKDAARDYESIFGASGKGVRETHPGTYWHTPVEATRSAQAQNWVINDDGSVEEIIGEVPADWTAAGNYSWATPENDYAYKYYRRPGAASTPEQKAGEAAKAKEEQMKNVKPKYQHTMFGISDLGPFTALAMQGLGIGRPDTSALMSAANSASNYTKAGWMPIDTRVKYVPNDPWFYTMPILAQSRGTDLAIDNSGINQGSRNAARLANSYNTTLAIGNAARQQLDSNYDRDMKARQLRGSLEEANQREYGTTSRFNAEAYNNASRANAQARMSAAAHAMDADAGWYNSLYGNVGNIFKNLEAHRQENARHNMIADMAANGLFGVMTPENYVGKNYLQWVGAKGGKVNKKKGKKGLTY